MRITHDRCKGWQARTGEVRLHLGRHSVALIAGWSRTHAGIGWDLSGHGGYCRVRIAH